jgi:hypothetical protein
MMRRPLLVSIAAVLLVASTVFPMGAQSRAGAESTGSVPTVSAIRALPLTCAQAWGHRNCKADPNALLFAIVDKHVPRVAGTAGEAK